MSAPDDDIEWPWEEDEDLPETPPTAPDNNDAVALAAPTLLQPPDDDRDQIDNDLNNRPDHYPTPRWEGLEIEPPPADIIAGPPPWLSTAPGDLPLPAWAKRPSEGEEGPPGGHPWEGPGGGPPPAGIIAGPPPWLSTAPGDLPLPAWAKRPFEGEEGPPGGHPWEDDDAEEEWEDEEEYLNKTPPPWAAAAPSPRIPTPNVVQDDIQLPDECMSEQLRELAKHPSQYVRVQVAAHPNCPADIMPQLAKDSSHMVRWALWERSDVPAEVLNHVDLLELPADEAYIIAASPACSYEQITAWYHERPDDNTIAVLSAMHPNAPDQWVQQILDNLSESVRIQLARSSSNERLQRFLFLNPNMAQHLADNPNCSTDLLDELAKSDDTKIKNLVVQHPRAPIAALALLIKDPDRRIANKAARHPNLPEEYKQLAKLV
jgi:hypothetical protein